MINQVGEECGYKKCKKLEENSEACKVCQDSVRKWMQDRGMLMASRQKEDK